MDEFGDDEDSPVAVADAPVVEHEFGSADSAMVAEISQGRHSGAVGSRRPPTRLGPLVIFLVVASSHGFWGALSPSLAEHGGDSHVVGMYMGRWILAYEAEARSRACGNEPGRKLLKAAQKEARQSCSCFGYLLYEALDWAELAAPSAFDAALPPSHILHQLMDLPTRGAYSTVRAFVDRARAAGASQVSTVGLATWLARPPFVCELGCHEIIFHVVVVTQRMLRRRLLSTCPRLVDLSDFKTLVQRQPLVRELSLSKQMRGWPNQHSAQHVIAWVTASMFLSDTKRHVEAAAAFSELFGNTGIATSDVLMDRLEKTGWDVLRRARVKIDAVAMLVYQAWFEANLARFESLNVYLFF